MAKTYSTDLEIKLLKPARAQYEVWDRDPSFPGLGIRVSPGGTKSFVLLYRMGGRSRRLTLGRYGTISLKKARLLAQKALVDIARGIDPQTAKIRTRETYNDNLFENVVTDYIEHYAKPNTRTWKETERVLNKGFVQKWRGLTIHQITKGHILSVLDDVVSTSGGSSANHAFSHIRRLFNWCAERGYIDHSPCTGMKRPAKSVKRDRVLTDDELVAVYRAAEQMGYPFGHIIQLLILTAQRRHEVTGICQSDINHDEKIWTLSAKNNKSGRKHLVPLSQPALNVINAVPFFHHDLLFPAQGRDVPASGFSKWKKKLDRLSGVKDWTLHDIRRTVSTGMAKLSVPPHVIEFVLNHRSQMLSGVAEIYNQYRYLNEQRNALEAWAKHVEKLIEDQCLAARCIGGYIDDQ